MTIKRLINKLNQLLKDYIKDNKYESAESLSEAINYIKDLENILSINNDIIIKIIDDQDRTIASIPFRSLDKFHCHYVLSEKELSGCYIKDIDSYNNNEVTYKLILNDKEVLIYDRKRC